VEDQGLFVGWLGLRASIGIIVEDKPNLIEQFPWCLITCVDSSRDMQKLRTSQRIVQDFGDECFFLGQGLQVPGRRVQALAQDYNLFNGFDNVWCFCKEPLILPERELHLDGPMRAEGKLVEDANNLDELREFIELFKRDNPKLKEWMQASECALGLGDGCGLTYATFHKGLADELENSWGKEKFSSPNDEQ
jgi:hypothetical protein